MYISLVGLFLITFQVVCHGAPKHLFGVPQHPTVFQDDKYVEKRDWCTADQLDRSLDCGSWAADGLCESYQLVHDNCYESCGYCVAAPVRVPPGEVDEDACLQAHNDKRALHQNTGALVWDATLAVHAQTWADHLAATGLFEHDSNRPVGEGENLYWASKIKAATCYYAVEAWYSEEKNYDYINARPSGLDKQIGRFTQVVWKGTSHVGVGKKLVNHSDGRIETYIVARYSPRGNFVGQYEDNVTDKKPGAI